MNNGISIKSTKEKQIEFNRIISGFLASNIHFVGSTTSSIGILIIITALLSLISIWIPILIGCYIFIRGVSKIISGSKYTLTVVQRKVLNFINSVNEDGS